MNATNISHTVLSANPVSPQRIAAAGSRATRPKTTATVIPMSPATAPGTTSVMRLAITATNTAKYCHASGVSPWGRGSTSTRAPAANGSTACHRCLGAGRARRSPAIGRHLGVLGLRFQRPPERHQSRTRLDDVVTVAGEAPQRRGEGRDLLGAVFAHRGQGGHRPDANAAGHDRAQQRLAAL